MTSRSEIRDLSPGSVNQTFLLTKPTLSETKTGKPFLRCTFRDKTGEISGIKWDTSELPASGVYRVFGMLEQYQGALSLKVSSMEPVEDDAGCAMSDQYALTSKMNGFDLGVWNDLPEETREMILRAAGSFELEIDRAFDEGKAEGKRDAESVAAAAQHIAMFRIGKAIDELDGAEFDDDESIIKARKHLKKAMGDLQ